MYVRTNHLDDHIVERTALPDELIRQVSGQTAFEEELPMVSGRMYQCGASKTSMQLTVVNAA